VLAFPPHEEDPKWRLLCRFWVPEASWDERCKRDPRYAAWAAAGAIETTPAGRSPWTRRLPQNAAMFA
jgi:phage terminase large subunit-like protein